MPGLCFTNKVTDSPVGLTVKASRHNPAPLPQASNTASVSHAKNRIMNIKLNFGLRKEISMV
jgi:hypothetical protein